MKTISTSRAFPLMRPHVSTMRRPSHEPAHGLASDTPIEESLNTFGRWAIVIGGVGIVACLICRGKKRYRRA